MLRDLLTSQNEDLGTGSAFGFSVGKYLTIALD